MVPSQVVSQNPVLGALVIRKVWIISVSFSKTACVGCSYSDELGKWMEVGNSGMFRPEMLRPMGLPEDVSVIAWGLSLERSACKVVLAPKGSMCCGLLELCTASLCVILPVCNILVCNTTLLHQYTLEFALPEPCCKPKPTFCTTAHISYKTTV